MALNSLFVLKLPLNSNQPTVQRLHTSKVLRYDMCLTIITQFHTLADTSHRLRSCATARTHSIAANWLVLSAKLRGKYCNGK